MNLFPSVIFSCVIVFSVWALAVFQPTQATASGIDKLSTTQGKQELLLVKNTRVKQNGSELTSYSHFESIQIAGVTQKISLSRMSSLWQDFNANSALQNGLKTKPNKVYVYYRNFSSNYESAVASIGYDIKLLSKPFNVMNLPGSRFEPLLNKNKYNDMQLQRAWEKVDYRKGIVAIVEVHYLNTDSAVNSSEVSISYK